MIEHAPKGTFTGIHPPLGEAGDGNCVIVQELGSDPTLRSNQEIVDFLLADERLRPLPLFVSGSIAKEIARRKAENPSLPIGPVVLAFEGPSADNRHENLGTYGELAQYRAVTYLHPREYDKPVLVTSGYNVGNVVRQAGLLDIDVIVPARLPRSFDWRSKQLWTKAWPLWALTSHWRIHRLKRHGH